MYFFIFDLCDYLLACKQMFALVKTCIACTDTGDVDLQKRTADCVCMPIKLGMLRKHMFKARQIFTEVNRKNIAV